MARRLPLTQIHSTPTYVPLHAAPAYDDISNAGFRCKRDGRSFANRRGSTNGRGTLFIRGAAPIPDMGYKTAAGGSVSLWRSSSCFLPQPRKQLHTFTPR
jgi:hypothetical protein